MSWLQLSIQTDPAAVERIETALLDAGALSVTMTDAADQPLLEPAPGETPLWDHIIMIGLFAADNEADALRKQVAAHACLDPAQIHVEALAEQEWTRTWMDHFQPMPFGQRLWVCPHGIEPPDPDAVNLRLDPGLAFGTGTHPTTALCLSWLDRQTLDNLQVLDYGCGSGILAIAAVLLGADSAWAVDNDEQALEATLSNASNNHVADRISTCLPGQLPDIHAGLTIANILAGPLCQLAPVLARHTRAQAWLALSGILTEQADEVRSCYQPWFDFGDPVERDGWVLLQARRNHNQVADAG